jgi:hypothetical protein
VCVCVCVCMCVYVCVCVSPYHHQDLVCEMCPYGLEAGLLLRTFDKKAWVHPVEINFACCLLFCCYNCCYVVFVLF